MMNRNSMPIGTSQVQLRQQKDFNSNKSVLHLSYDGSFNGFLTAIWHRRKMNNNLEVALQRGQAEQISIFKTTKYILANQSIARQLWHELDKNKKPSARIAYFAYLAEKKYLNQALFNYLSQADSAEPMDPEVHKALEKAANEVQNEKLRYEKELELHKNNDTLWVAELHPRFDIIPLLSRHIKKKYAGCDWFIWDSKRRYGVLCQHGQCTLTKKRLHHRSALAS